MNDHFLRADILTHFSQFSPVKKYYRVIMDTMLSNILEMGTNVCVLSFISLNHSDCQEMWIVRSCIDHFFWPWEL